MVNLDIHRLINPDIVNQFIPAKLIRYHTTVSSDVQRSVFKH